MVRPFVVPPGNPYELASRAAALSALFNADSLGQPWSHWIETRPGDCEPFHGTSYVIGPTDYFLLRCQSDFEGGQLTADSYLLGGDDEPTVERLTWTIGPSDGLVQQGLNQLSNTLVADLAVRLGASAPPAPNSLLEPGSSDWQRIARFSSPGGILYVFLAPSGGGGVLDSLIVMHSSHRLLAEAEGDTSGDRYDERKEAGLVSLDVLAEVSRALTSSWPRLAAAMRPSGSELKDLPAVQAALSQARGDGLSIAERDLLHYSAHLWMRGCNALPGWEAGDSTAVRPIMDALGRYHVGLVRTYEGGWCYDGALAESLAARVGESRWSDLAFVELLDRGWESPCALCGWDKPFGPDLFKPVIEHGEAYLATHPRSEIADAVALRVAEAHETAWSLSKAASGDDYIDSNRYLLKAPKHRERALELYDQILEGKSDTWEPKLRDRLRRMRLDIDTDFHEYWCLWD